MPICLKCGKYFPNWVKINGIPKNLQCRNYCLDCSPFGKHNTTLLHIIQDKFCLYCGNRLTGKQIRFCSRLCNQKFIVTIRRQILKKKSVEYKGGKCEICGYDKCIDALEFHHKDPKEKEFTLSKIMSYAWSRIKKELDKCVLVCSNCHREIHSKEKHLYIS